MSGVRDFISFQGRGGRIECLLVCPLAAGIWTAVAFLWADTALTPGSSAAKLSLTSTTLTVATLVCLWVYTAALIRRLRDAGRSPWWVVICLVAAYLCPPVGILAWMVVAVLPPRRRCCPPAIHEERLVWTVRQSAKRETDGKEQEGESYPDPDRRQ